MVASMTEIDRYAVLGQPIAHSKSPRIHQLFAEQTSERLQYSALEVPAEQFTDVVTSFFANGGQGLNCTVPLKELAWAYAEIKTERAQLAKAVNTLALQQDGSILGDNTDGVGLVTDLKNNHDIALTGMRILILGAGGASRGIIGPLLVEEPEQIVIVNRTFAKAQQLVTEFAGKGRVSACGYSDLNGQLFDLIINATSSSLTDELPPLPDGLLASQGSCYDLAYSNKATVFVRWGLEHKALKSLDGLGMLVEQAAEAFYNWRGIRPQTKPIIDLLNAER
jgi:shikimate dehydrogenase